MLVGLRGYVGRAVVAALCLTAAGSRLTGGLHACAGLCLIAALWLAAAVCLTTALCLTAALCLKLGGASDEVIAFRLRWHVASVPTYLRECFNGIDIVMQIAIRGVFQTR